MTLKSTADTGIQIASVIGRYFAMDRDNRWDAIFYVKNVFDEFYVTNIASNVDIFIPNAYIQQVPRYSERTAGMELRYRW